MKEKIADMWAMLYLICLMSKEFTEIIDRATDVIEMGRERIYCDVVVRRHDYEYMPLRQSALCGYYTLIIGTSDDGTVHWDAEFENYEWGEWELQYERDLVRK